MRKPIFNFQTPVLIQFLNYFSDVLIKVPVSWKIVPIISPMNSSEAEALQVESKSLFNSHVKKSAKQNMRKKSEVKISNKKIIFKEPKTPLYQVGKSSNTALKVATGGYKTISSITALSSDEKPNSISLVQSSILNPSNSNSKNICIPAEKQSSAGLGWNINSSKSFILEDVIKTNNFNITKFSQVISSDSGDSCLDSVTLTYPISQINDKNDIVIDSGYNNEKNPILEPSVDLTSSENDQLCPYGSILDAQPKSQPIGLQVRRVTINTENIKPAEQCILNPKKKLIERAKHSMNNSDEIFFEDKTNIKKTPADQKNEDIDNNNLKSVDNLLHQSDKHSTSQNTKVRKVYKHLSNIKTNSTDVSNVTLNSFSSNIKNSFVAHGKMNKNKNNVKSTTSSAPNNKTTKYRKYTKKDLLNLRRKMKSPPIPESIKNIRIKEVYPDHWNCVYCSKEITYNDIYEHSTTCLHIDTDEYGKHLICCICKYATMKLSNLRKHIWTHTGEKPFKCYKCSYNSTQSSNLRMHLKIKHGVVNIIN